MNLALAQACSLREAKIWREYTATAESRTAREVFAQLGITRTSCNKGHTGRILNFSSCQPVETLILVSVTAAIA
jgi:hypothetical protein